MSERRFKDQVADVLTEPLPDGGGVLERWLAPTTESRIEQIPVELIRDRALRTDVDTTDPTYRALKASIRASGVLQPLLLRPHSGGGYEVVSGARRLRAARDTAQATVPAVVRELNDVQALIGGSWDAVLRIGLTPTQARDLVVDLVAVGMDEGEAITLVSTAPLRHRRSTPAVGKGSAAQAAAGVAVDADVPAAVVEPAENAELALVADPEVDVATSTDIAVDAEAVTPPDATTTAATEAAPAVEVVAAHQVELEHAEGAVAVDLDLAIDFDEDSLGWPAPDEPSTETAPTTPPIPLPLDPTPFPLAEAGRGNGVATLEATTAVATPETEASDSNGVLAGGLTAPAGPTDSTANGSASAVIAEAELTTEVPAPDVPRTDDTPAVVVTTDEPAVVVAPADASAVAGASPHVISISLPDAATAVAADDDAALAGSMPVAAPAAAADVEVGSRLLTPPPSTDTEAIAPTPGRSARVPGVLHRGPLFYAVLGIGLAVGAIVFILTSVFQGVGGTTSIIAAVVVAVAGFITAMVSLAQPRQRV
jgi:hypothetical protein